MNENGQMFLTVPEAGRLLGVSRASAWRMVHKRLLTSYSFPCGGIRIAFEDLEAFKAKCRRPAIASAPAGPRLRTKAEARTVVDQLAWKSKREALARLGRSH